MEIFLMMNDDYFHYRFHKVAEKARESKQLYDFMISTSLGLLGTSFEFSLSADKF